MLDLVPNAPALFSAVAAALFAGLAALVFLARPDRPANRFLGAFFLGGAAWTASNALLYASADAADVHAHAIAGALPVFLFHWAYFRFLGTLPTPLARPLRSRLARALAVAVVIALTLAVLLQPAIANAGVRPGTATPWLNVPGPLWAPFDAAAMVLLALAIVVAVSAYRHVSTPTSRRQMRWYLAGFVVYDASLFLLLAASLVPALRDGALQVPLWFSFVHSTATAWLAGALSYGILQTQLFDIDLKIKWGVRKGTVAAFFVAAFFVASELAAAFLSERIGVVAGIVAAGLLVFALAPLQRAADQLADAAMPHVRDDEQYLTVRKAEVYRAAVESALLDGAVTERERDVLAALADQLGLSAGEARALERAVIEGSTPGASS